MPGLQPCLIRHGLQGQRVFAGASADILFLVKKLDAGGNLAYKAPIFSLPGGISCFLHGRT